MRDPFWGLGFKVCWLWNPTKEVLKAYVLCTACPFQRYKGTFSGRGPLSLTQSSRILIVGTPKASRVRCKGS